MEWEFAFLNSIQKIRTDFLDKLMPCITFLGQWAVLWIVIAVLCLAFRQKKKTRHIPHFQHHYKHYCLQHHIQAHRSKTASLYPQRHN